MPFASWAEFYKSDAQSVYLLIALPIAFLAFRCAARSRDRAPIDPASAAFVATLTLVFALETILDPIATGPLTRALGWQDQFAGTLVMFIFVWLGDFRVFALVLGIAQRDHGTRHALIRAAALTCVVPIFAGVTNGLLHAAVPDLPAQTLWLIYELAFMSVAIYLGRVWVPAHVSDDAVRAYLQSMAGYSAAYYALWASADVIIMVVGNDSGWAFRVIPNQLYYGGWVIVAYTRFFSRPAAAGRRST
jgi:hypothetical protein